MARKKTITTPAQDKINAIGIDAICDDVIECVPLRKIAAKCNVSFGTLAAYLSRPEHIDQYARARESQADKMAEDILQIADDGLNDTYTDDSGNDRTNQDVIARSRLRVDARKWLASKMAPKKYGEKLDLNHSGSIDLTDEQLDAKLTNLLGKAGTTSST